MDFIEINPNTCKGVIPKGYDLVVTENTESLRLSSALVLYGWDEIGLFDNKFKNPIYGFLKV